MKKYKLSELVLDFDLYIRNNIDEHNVRNLVDAIESGVELPPFIICKKSKRIVDGFHRKRAKVRVYGEDAEVEVIEKAYKNEGEMLLDAARYNATHGAKLDTCDRTRCAIIADRLSVSVTALAQALNMPVDKLADLKADRTARGAGGLTIPLKRTFRHKAGQRLSKQQQAANTRSSGMNQMFYANQLIDLIEADLLEADNESLWERLKRLHELLEELLVST